MPGDAATRITAPQGRTTRATATNRSGRRSEVVGGLMRAGRLRLGQVRALGILMLQRLVQLRLPPLG